MGEIGRARVAGDLSWDRSRLALLAAYEAAMAAGGRTVTPEKVPESVTGGLSDPTAGVGGPSVTATHPGQRAIDNEDGQVAAGVERADGPPADERSEGSEAESPLPVRTTQRGELPVATPDSNPSLKVGSNGASRPDQ